jgi:hypothetical protein
MDSRIQSLEIIASASTVAAGALLGVFAIIAGHACRAIWSTIRDQRRSALVLENLVRDLKLEPSQAHKLRVAWWTRYAP